MTETQIDPKVSNRMYRGLCLICTPCMYGIGLYTFHSTGKPGYLVQLTKRATCWLLNGALERWEYILDLVLDLNLKWSRCALQPFSTHNDFCEPYQIALLLEKPCSAHFWYELSPSPMTAYFMLHSESDGRLRLSRNFQNFLMLSGASPCPVVEHTNTTRLADGNNLWNGENITTYH